MTYGPFRDSCKVRLRLQYLAELRALTRVCAGPAAGSVINALTHALERPSDAAVLADAQRAFDALPSRPRRRVLAAFAALQREVARE